MDEFLATFVFFFAVIDPIGTIPVFIAVTTGYNEKQKRKIALKAVLISAIVLLFFIAVGELILNAINIPLSAFQIAGGIVLFIFAMTMIFGKGKPEEEKEMISSVSETAVYPLAMPSIASPGAMLAAVLLTENSRFSLWEQAQSSAAMLGVLALVLLFMLGASKIHKYIGDSGASIISRVMGLILASVAVSSVLHGIDIYFQILTLG
ncbi:MULTISPECIES: MarC family protein [unclassified Lentimicrobium]|uniref:MarC family protein n=1 Tax=unclassified Lentimicrobium TaxID=2677434 RepID=UPI0015565FA5|nr:MULTISPECIES: MarC family protein [unclassified Lentimicrobium]NPD44212.1 MarC family protein [Lentimicrobium sp. S6]NPD86453.1 MarC family protein [Lentimicrobium sp. L6]